MSGNFTVTGPVGIRQGTYMLCNTCELFTYIPIESTSKRIGMNGIMCVPTITSLYSWFIMYQSTIIHVLFNFLLVLY